MHKSNNVAVEIKSIAKQYPLIKPVNRDTDENLSLFWALKDVSLDISRGDVVGIIGRNGAGKTTLLNIIAGVSSPTKGSCVVKGRALGLFNLGAGFQDELTGKENVFLNGVLLGATRRELTEKMPSIIRFSELGSFIDMPLGTYSQGMRLRLGFSIIANLDFDVLVIDEVLAVGDVLFQNKCFEQIMNFSCSGKTLVITNQNMDLIERFCTKTMLLNHGQMLFYGNPLEAINRYRALLNTEKFFVGVAQKHIELIENTKKWTDDISYWDRKMGTKEVIMDSVELIDKFGCKRNHVKSGQPIEIRVNFTARKDIKDVHFGIAIFRNDGVYCYGPNTNFDKYNIPEIKQSRGFFSLYYYKMLLAPGEYRLSVAIWDKNEAVAFDYHNGCYKLMVKGYVNLDKELLNIPFKLDSGSIFCNRFFLKQRNKHGFDVNRLVGKYKEKEEVKGVQIESVQLFNCYNEKKNVFMTNESINIMTNFKDEDFGNVAKDLSLWLGIYRDDGIYCQGIIAVCNNRKSISMLLPEAPLLPGAYTISVGILDTKEQKFLVYHRSIYAFKMVFNRDDHGTVYLKHRWKWKFSGGIT